jgi:multicomponent Na+:H+ antiporter subunit B
MTERVRLRVFFVAAVIFFGLYVTAAHNMPAWGDYRGPYGDVIARAAVYERHAMDVVNAINYDYRGFDTLGEEFILFAAAVGVMMLLRREPKQGRSAQQPATVVDRPRMSSAVRAANIPVIAITTLFGLYIGLHGQLTPGGGFQAGVILASALLLLYLADNLQLFNRITSHTAVEVIEAIGAGSYALIGIAPLCLALPLLTNILPLGQTGDVFSSGNIALISACVGVEVTASFLSVMASYLEEIIAGQRPEE